MPKYLINPIHSKLGIQRDGTRYDSECYIDGQWCRFYEGDPRKMGGYQDVSDGTTQIIRSLFTVYQPNSIDLYIGRSDSVGFINFNFDGTGSDETDRTPTSFFTPDPLNLWNFDLFIQRIPLVGEVTYIVGQVSPNSENISNDQEGYIFYGAITEQTPLQVVTDGGIPSLPVTTSGGIVFVAPFLIAYGNNGQIKWCNSRDITTWDPLNTETIANTKLVNAYVSRGGTLFWSLNQLILVNYDTTLADPTFVGRVIENITIMSANSIVNYNQMFFWVGTDQFYFYNGIVQKLPNQMNCDWFFENINQNERSKVWGMVVARFGEIWWFYPRGDATECNAVVIFNIDQNTWYDSFLNRSCGVSASTMPYPIMADNQTIRSIVGPEFVDTYPLWIHEKGTDRVQGNNTYAIDSFFETHKFDLWTADGTTSNLIRNRRIAPDFVQIGDMTAIINTQTYPKSPVISEGPYTFTPTTEKIDFATQGGLVSFQFRSNEAGGFYQGGKILYFYDLGDTLK